MSSSPVLRWSVALLLPLTLGWKLAVRPADPHEVAQREKAAQLRVADFLARNRFSVAVSDQIEEGKPSIRATAGPCRLLVVNSTAMGWDRDLIRRNATDTDRVFVVFYGKIYLDQPTWLTVSDFLWARFRRELGFRAEAAPILAVIATTSCAAERLPWDELA